MQTVARPFSLALANAGNRSAARMAMIAITTNSSIRVKPRFVFPCDSPIKVPRLEFLFAEQLNVNQLGITKTSMAVEKEHI